jgi:hypothetical protein
MPWRFDWEFAAAAVCESRWEYREAGALLEVKAVFGMGQGGGGLGTKTGFKSESCKAVDAGKEGHSFSGITSRHGRRDKAGCIGCTRGFGKEGEDSALTTGHEGRAEFVLDVSNGLA